MTQTELDPTTGSNGDDDVTAHILWHSQAAQKTAEELSSDGSPLLPHDDIRRQPLTVLQEHRFQESLATEITRRYSMQTEQQLAARRRSSNVFRAFQWLFGSKVPDGF